MKELQYQYRITPEVGTLGLFPVITVMGRSAYDIARKWAMDNMGVDNIWHSSRCNEFCSTYKGIKGGTMFYIHIEKLTA